MENSIRINRIEDANEVRTNHPVAFAGLYLFTLLLYVRPNELFPNLLGDLPITKTVAIVTLLTYVGSKLFNSESLSIWPAELWMICAIALLGVAMIPWTASPRDTVDLLTDLFLKIVTIFVLMINLLDTRDRLRSFLKLVVICGTLLAIFAISNFVTGRFLTEDKHVGVRIAGVVGGIFGNPNDLATSLDLLVPLAVGLALTQRGFKRLFYFVCAGFMVTAIVFTFSRGGFLGLVAMSSVLLWHVGRNHRIVSVMAFLLLTGVFAVSMPVGYSSRITSILNTESDTTGSAQMRRDLIERATTLAISHPVIGVGMGNFHIYSIREGRAHNAYLEIAAELGVAGLVAYLVMLFYPLRSMRRVERDARERLITARGDPESTESLKETVYLSSALQASLIAYLVCSLFGSIQYVWFVYYPIAYAVALRRIHRAEYGPEVSRSTDEIGVLWRRGPVLREAE